MLCTGVWEGGEDLVPLTQALSMTTPLDDPTPLTTLLDDPTSLTTPSHNPGPLDCPCTTLHQSNDVATLKFVNVTQCIITAVIW